LPEKIRAFSASIRAKAEEIESFGQSRRVENPVLNLGSGSKMRLASLGMGSRIQGSCYSLSEKKEGSG